MRFIERKLIAAEARMTGALVHLIERDGTSGQTAPELVHISLTIYPPKTAIGEIPRIALDSYGLRRLVKRGTVHRENSKPLPTYYLDDDTFQRFSKLKTTNNL